jgi:hypothetical protein
MSTNANPGSLRRNVCAVALPAFPLALLVSTLISPTDSEANVEQLRAAAGHGSAWQAAALLELLAAALMAFAVAGVVSLVRHRGKGLASAAGVFGVLGTLGVAAIGFRHLFIYGLAGADSATALHVLDRIDNSAGAAALPLMFAGPIALILISAATARAGFAPRWVTLGAILFFITDMLPIPAAEELQGVIGLATFGTVAVGMLRDAEDGQDTPERATRSISSVSPDTLATEAGI